MARTYRGEVARKTLERFPDVPIHALAKFLVKYHSGLFDDVETARHRLRYYAGKDGDANRSKAKKANSLVISGIPRKLPKSESEILIDYHLKPGNWLILSDIHIPYHSDVAVKAAISYAKKQKIDGIFLNGDAQDCEAVGFWRPTRKRDFVREVMLMADFLDYLREQFPKSDIVWKRGNHEERLSNYYRNNAPDLADLPTVGLETVLSLDTRGIVYIDGKNIVRAGNLPIFHGHELRGGFSPIGPAKWLFGKASMAAVCAHFHKVGSWDDTNIDGDLITTYSLGCLCNMTPDYNPYANKWSHGFATVEVLSDNSYSFTNKKIHDGKVID